MVLHDFTCLAHGNFESSKEAPACPKGCSPKLVRKVFLKPPAYHAGSTANIDRNLKMLAADFGLTDMNNQNGTAAATRIDWRKQREADVLAGRSFEMAMAEGANAVSGTMAQIGAQSGNAINDVRSELKPMAPIVHGAYRPERMPEAPA